MSLEQRGLQPPGHQPLAQVDRVVTLAVIRTIDGMEIRGTIHIPPGVRVLGLLNRPAEQYLAVTDATVAVSGRTEHAGFIAVNKAHVITLREVAG